MSGMVDLSDLRVLYSRGEERAFQRWANKQDVKSLKLFCRANGVPVEGQKTRGKMLKAIHGLIAA